MDDTIMFGTDDHHYEAVRKIRSHNDGYVLETDDALELLEALQDTDAVYARTREPATQTVRHVTQDRDDYIPLDETAVNDMTYNIPEFDYMVYGYPEGRITIWHHAMGEWEVISDALGAHDA